MPLGDSTSTSRKFRRDYRASPKPNGNRNKPALNNLKRFTEAQFGPEPYTFVSYRQNELVMVNAYQNLPAEHLLRLWQALNRQILYVVRDLPEAAQQRKVLVKGSDGPPHTLSWLIQDYVGHMEHHFRTLL
jgi:hypothetical protein